MGCQCSPPAASTACVCFPTIPGLCTRLGKPEGSMKTHSHLNDVAETNPLKSKPSPLIYYVIVDKR